MPDVPTVAMEVAELLQVPPEVTSESDAVPPRQMLTALDGIMAAGLGLTVTMVVMEQLGPVL